MSATFAAPLSAVLSQRRAARLNVGQALWTQRLRREKIVGGSSLSVAYPIK
jgi:hypothetical protein